VVVKKVGKKEDPKQKLDDKGTEITAEQTAEEKAKAEKLEKEEKDRLGRIAEIKTTIMAEVYEGIRIMKERNALNERIALLATECNEIKKRIAEAEKAELLEKEKNINVETQEEKNPPTENKEPDTNKIENKDLSTGH